MVDSLRSLLITSPFREFSQGSEKFPSVPKNVSGGRGFGVGWGYRVRYQVYLIRFVETEPRFTPPSIGHAAAIGHAVFGNVVAGHVILQSVVGDRTNAVIGTVSNRTLCRSSPPL